MASVFLCLCRDLPQVAEQRPRQPAHPAIMLIASRAKPAIDNHDRHASPGSRVQKVGPELALGQHDDAWIDAPQGAVHGPGGIERPVTNGEIRKRRRASSKPVSVLVDSTHSQPE